MVHSGSDEYPVLLDEVGCRQIVLLNYPGVTPGSLATDVSMCADGATAWNLYFMDVLGGELTFAYANLILHLASAPGFGWPDGAPPAVAPQPSK